MKNTLGRATSLLREIESVLAELGLPKDETVLHWHNHSLGKNNAAPEVIRQMATRGWRFLLQVHDFAEDNRPSNYAGIIRDCEASNKPDVDQFLYPLANQIHYASLTGGDAEVFRELGIESIRTHCLPNSVSMNHTDVDHDHALALVRGTMGLTSGSRWCLYPVRGIRRKNVGEFVLLSQWLPEDVFCGITIAPKNPAELASYQRWKHVAEQLAPKAVFDAGENDCVSFAENVAASEFILSTSVAEGFGMAYLEPWLAGRGVIARNLPTVTHDFADNGVKFSGLYDQIPIPGDASWLAECQQEIADAECQAWSELDPIFRPSKEDDSHINETIDFARLTPNRQVDVLNHLSHDEGFRDAVRGHSEALIRCLHDSIDSDLIESNRKVVQNQYSIDRQTSRLIKIYELILAADVDRETHAPVGGPAIDCISKMRPFFPCRTEASNA